MPDLVTHFYFGGCVLDSLNSDLQGHIKRDVYDFCCDGPDVWFSIGFLGGKYSEYASRGNIMQNEKTGAFLCTLADECKAADNPDMLFSYLAGFICHYCLDSHCHPYIECKTGNYDGTVETRRYRGKHTRLERAIDSYIIRNKYHCTPPRFPFRKKILKLDKLPFELKSGLEHVYDKVYGWKNVFPLLQRCIRDQRLFYALAADRAGLLTPVLKLIDDGKSREEFPSLTYYGKEISHQNLDYLNENKKAWHHPFDSSVVSEAGFFELFSCAQADAAKMINACYDYIYQNGIHPAAVLGNRNYETGFDCGDQRNKEKPHFDPLF